MLETSEDSTTPADTTYKTQLAQVRTNVRRWPGADTDTLMAACYLQLGKYDAAVRACDYALQTDASNEKAMSVHLALLHSHAQLPEGSGSAYAGAAVCSARFAGAACA